MSSPTYKGATGLIKIIEDLHNKGYYIFTPFHEDSPVDLIAVNRITNQTLKLQVKFFSEPRDLQTRSVVNGKSVYIDRTAINGWAIYIESENTILYISTDFMAGRKTHKINTKNNYGELAEWSKAAPC